MTNPPERPEVWGKLETESMSYYIGTPPRPSKLGSGIIGAIGSLRSSIERIGMSKNDAALARVADEMFDRVRPNGGLGRDRVQEGDYDTGDTYHPQRISEFAELVQKSEIGWQRDQVSGILLADFYVPVFINGNQIEFHFDDIKSYPTRGQYSSSLSIKRSERMILAHTLLERPIGAARDPYDNPFTRFRYEEILFVDTANSDYKLYKSSSIDRVPLSYRTLTAALPDQIGIDSFNIGTMPSPEILPSDSQKPKATED